MLSGFICAYFSTPVGSVVGNIPIGNLPCENKTSINCPYAAKTLVFVNLDEYSRLSLNHEKPYLHYRYLYSFDKTLTIFSHHKVEPVLILLV